MKKELNTEELENLKDLIASGYLENIEIAKTLYKNYKKSEVIDSYIKITKICTKYNIKNYTINDDYSVDVNGNVILYSKKLKVLPLKFNKVNGRFRCDFNKLTTLEGCPKYVEGDFCCSDNLLTTLEGGPEFVGKSFYCDYKIY